MIPSLEEVSKAHFTSFNESRNTDYANIFTSMIKATDFKSKSKAAAMLLAQIERRCDMSDELLAALKDWNEKTNNWLKRAFLDDEQPYKTALETVEQFIEWIDKGKMNSAYKWYFKERFSSFDEMLLQARQAAKFERRELDYVHVWTRLTEANFIEFLQSHLPRAYTRRRHKEFLTAENCGWWNGIVVHQWYIEQQELNNKARAKKKAKEFNDMIDRSIERQRLREIEIARPKPNKEFDFKSPKDILYLKKAKTNDHRLIKARHTTAAYFLLVNHGIAEELSSEQLEIIGSSTIRGNYSKIKNAEAKKQTVLNKSDWLIVAELLQKFPNVQKAALNKTA